MIESGYGITNRVGKLSSDYANAGMGQSSPVVEHTEIERRLIELDARNEDLRSILSGFQVKLQSVLVPQMKNEATGGQVTPRPVLSPMADRLDKIIDENRHMASILRDLFDRIAL